MERPDLTLEEVAILTRKHRETLRRLARSKKLIGAYRIGGRWMVRAEALAQLRGIPA
jgi:excisionase family DNA binding protein